MNQNISVTNIKLKKLLQVKGVEIDLPVITAESKKILTAMTGVSKYKGYFGVYVFMEKSTGMKYVGSSNLLRRRMEYYFNYKGQLSQATPLESRKEGKFLPLLRVKGLSAFKLIIYKLNSEIFSFQDALILEQYFLLSNEFELNSLKVVNMGSYKGDGVFVYDLNCKTLFYHAESRIELKRVLKIHPETCKNYIDSKIPYLNKFLLLSHLIPTALISNISVQELLNIMVNERKNMYVLGTRRSIPVVLEIKEGNTFVESALIGQNLKFDSLTSCVSYLRDLGLTIKRDTLSKYIKLEKEFYNFICKYSDKELPNNFKEIGLIIDEYSRSAPKLKSKEILALKYSNKKNKAILVKKVNLSSNENTVEEYKEFNSIVETILYFKNLGINLDRKTLYISIKNRKNYKGYFFCYKNQDA